MAHFVLKCNKKDYVSINLIVQRFQTHFLSTRGAQHTQVRSRAVQVHNFERLYSDSKNLIKSS